MKRTGNKNLKIIAATSMTIFSLFAVFSATYAWFMANKNVYNTNDNFDVNTVSGMFNKMTIHKSVNITDDEYIFDADPWGTITIDDWKNKQFSKDFDGSCLMGRYDYLEKSHPILMLIQLGEDEGTGYEASQNSPIKVTAKASTDYFVGDMAAGRTIYAANQIDSNHINPLSSVVSYRSTYFDSDSSLEAYYDEDNFTQGLTTYDTYTFSISSLNNATGSFTQFSNNAYSDFLPNQTVFTTSSLDYTDPTATYRVKYVAVVFNYYEAAMEAVYSAFIGDPVLENVLVFNCDWSMEI